MRDDDWSTLMLGLLDGVESRLPDEATSDVRQKLGILRSRIVNNKKSSSRKNIEREVEAFLESSTLLKDRCGQYIVGLLEPALSQLDDTLNTIEARRREKLKTTEPNQAPNQ
ncbi:MAG: hypothetical protein JF599_09125 [Verrucomicrobia bacterium]|nr:hypothetical protein [Verrucomicrobiota bacterium]